MTFNIFVMYLFAISFILFLLVELFDINNRKFLKFVAVVMLIPIMISGCSLFLPSINIILGECYELVAKIF